MQTTPRSRAIQIILWLLPFVPITSLAYHYDGLYMYMIAGGIQAALIAVAAWFLGLGDARRRTPNQRVLAAGAALLVASGAVVSLGWNMGAPPAGEEFLATRLDQQFRYTALLIGAILAMGGLTVLRSSLRQAGDHVLSSLGHTTMLLSTLLFAVVNAALQIGFEAVRQESSTGQEPNWVEPFRNYFVYLTIFWAVLAYAGIACYAASLRKAGWMNPVVAWTFAGVSIAAMGLVPFFPLAPGPLGLPGFVLAIPAVPYFMPYWMGVNLVKRAAEAGVATITAKAA
ncbi:MAG: hypothetical protein LAP39_09005 [Acidobacteriia bacterium]|nr:hypothetical protein [Terriglobia bacterium]